MPINALPQETLRLLGSPLVYSSSASLVKELVDNAIDANATSIDVFISANTVDSIEVRDNGQGIPPDDFGALGFRGCTSKLRNFEDIQTIGGVSLGFRGEALAAATTLATLTIVTRTAGDSTASKLYFAGKGGVERIDRVPAPIGTSVRAVNLFAQLPVRKQCALKEAPKTISKIKDLLHSYAFARPHIRISLRVQNQPKSSWSYSPGPHPSMREAALHIFGSELVSQCGEKTLSKGRGATSTTAHDELRISNAYEEGNYTIQALLPKPGCDPTKLSKGAWVSVDSRPVSSSRGTIRALYSTFKAWLAQNLELTGSISRVKSPFLAVNIKCPPRSYDPNIEPSKDDVLFTDARGLVEMFECLLGQVSWSRSPCGLPSVVRKNAGLSNIPSEVPQDQRQGSRDVPPEHTSACSPPYSLTSVTESFLDPCVQGLADVSRPRPDRPLNSRGMTRDDITKLEKGSQYRSPPSSDDLKPHTVSNSRAPTHSGIVSDYERQNSAGGRRVDMPLGKENDGNPTNTIDCRLHGKETDTTRDSADAPLKATEGVNPWVIAKFNAKSNQDRPVAVPVHEPRSIVHPSPARAPGASSDEEYHMARMLLRVPPRMDGATAERALGKRGVPGDAYRLPLSTHTQRVRRQMVSHREPTTSFASFRRGHEAYRSPTNGITKHSDREEQNNNWFQGTLDFSAHRNKRLQRKPVVADGSDTDRVSQARPSGQDPEKNHDIRAMHRRRANAENRMLRELQDEGGNNAADPERSEIVGISGETTMQTSRLPPGVSKNGAAAKTGLPARDPRSYLMQRRCSMPATTPRKLRRVKSCMLPLETTPAGQETHNLMQTIEIDMQQLCRHVAMNNDQCATDVTTGGGLGRSISQSDLEEIEHQVRELFLRLGLDEQCRVELSAPLGEEVKPSQVAARV